ncbi:probable nucleolar protein 8 at N-terminal half [Coccomyxa sp. Obi]|nr:probable nucleolar protein 8 at N-terminal half [Coccomyxa sp. Obi]
MMGPDSLKEETRLYVGGLPHDVSPEQIAQRFQSFGTVQSVELVPEKKGSVYAGPTLKQCRGFAFVQLSPKDETALHRCVSMYNGCKWMGGVLRVEPASMHYKARLAKEESDELSRKQPLEQDQAHVRLQPGDDGPDERNREDAAPLTILRRDGKKTMRAVPNRAKTYFPPVKQPRTGDLSWAPVEPPPGAVKKEQVSTLLAKIPSSALTRNLQAQVTPLTAQSEKMESTDVNRHAQEAVHQQKLIVVEEQEQRQESSESEELGAVDFMDSDDEQRPPVVLDSRFDSSSDDEEAAPLRASAHAVTAAALKASALQSSGNKKQLSMAKQQAEAPSKRAAQADQSHSSNGEAGGVSKQMVEAYPEQAVRMAAMHEVAESDSSGGEDEGDAHAEARTRPPAVQPEQADCSDGEEGNELAAAGIMPPAAQGGEADSSEVSESEEVGGSTARGSSGDVRDSSSDTGSAAGEEASSSLSEQDSDEDLEEHPIHGGGVEVRPLGGQRQDPADEVTGSGMQQSDSEQEEGESLGGEVGVSRGDKQALNAEDGDNAADDQPGSDGGTDSDSEQAGSPLRAAPKEGETNGGEASIDVLSGLASVLPKGAAFCRLVGGTELEAAWRAARDSLVADYKSKRRTALKQLPASKRGRYHA